MPQRHFVDPQGRAWTVWDVLPSRVSRELDAAWVALHERDAGAEERPRPRATLPERFSGGWLCFETAGEKRRLAPVPRGWERLSEIELARLCHTAPRVGARPMPSASVEEHPQPE